MDGGARKYYVVRPGRRPGIYTSWPVANRQVKGFSNCNHRSFATYEDAVAYMERGDDGGEVGEGEDPLMVQPISAAGTGARERIDGGGTGRSRTESRAGASSFCSWQN
ncbi:hypothetical protein PIB30_075255 [Stylosanthes scabra]|uniref:Ribonuclease H1 N-terminal domain-containing protein n=1 Tax=Stylosanthes scabra TaxID=79078 RepID=A0ABU6YRP4_9FABA|nr:hypothetical protein [Stylosanthes scabra]